MFCFTTGGKLPQLVVLVGVYVYCLSRINPVQASFNDDFYVTWGRDHVKVLDNGRQMQLTLDQSSGSRIGSKNKYLFGTIDMQIKLVPGNSAGTVTTYYLSSESSHHDELDFEFLGNISGQPYILQTNVFAYGVGNREQRIYLWFDPSANFHTYSVLWNQRHIVFSVDGIPIRAFADNEAVGVPYLNKQPMRIISGIWNGDSWATRGGLDKIDWTQAPFVSSFRNYKQDACKWTGAADPNCLAGKWWTQAPSQSLDSDQERKLAWVRQKFLIYDYCMDEGRNPVPPPECSRQS